jgi:hypothetical protein
MTLPAHALILTLLAFTTTAATPLKVDSSGKPGFTLLSPTRTGIIFTNHLAQDRHLTNQILLNGSGVAAGDVDGDGWCDLYFCALDGPNKLFRNRGGWKFEDITASANVALTELDATGAAFADLDGDGDLDLIVNSLVAGTHVLFNNGRGHFTVAAVLNKNRAGTSMALADIDGDGDLDLYLANYRRVTLRDQPNTHFTIKTINGQPQVTAVDGRPLTDPELTNRFTFRITMTERGGNFGQDEHGEEDVLFINDGKGKFTARPPLENAPYDWGLSVMFRDLNQDGAPDIYVCNDFRSPDRIWMNDGKGNFRPAEPLAFRQTSLSSMGVDVADINRDGYDDIFVVDMLSRDHFHRHMQRIEIRPEVVPANAIEYRPQYPRNTLFLNRGDGTYAEIAQLSGLEATEWSWTPIFLDVDLDGYEDVLVSNGFERDGMNVDVLRRLEIAKREKKLSNLELLRLRKMFPRLDTANLAFRNLGNLKFADTSAEWGFNARGVSQGMALADLDNDGDMDVAINNSNDAAATYRNNCPASRIAVRLKGKAPNTFGIGARIKVGEQAQEMISGGRYLSSDQPLRVFAARSNITIEVTWRSGTGTVVSNAEPNHLYEVEEFGVPSRAMRDGPSQRPPKGGTPYFVDVSHLLNHSLPVEPTPEFPPLWSPLSQQPSPTLLWRDLDADGWEDLCVGTNCFRNDGKGRFTRMNGGQAVRAAITELPAEIREHYRGFWRAATVGDFDGNGQQDYVGGNLGQNTKYESFRKKGLRIIKTDLGDLEAYDDLPLQPLHLVGAALPWIRERFPTAEAYAKSSFNEIHGEHLKAASQEQLTWFESTVFLNRGKQYEPIPLPIEAQLSPVSAICVADFNADRKQDIFLAQNLFAVHPETSRLDAGRGLLLRGHGDGRFTAIPGQESGILIYGEQLSAAACDYDHDGGVDLAVTQTGAQTKLYRNVWKR